MSWFWFLLSLAYIAYLHGTSSLFIVAIAMGNFILVKFVGGTSLLPAILWAYNIFFVVSNRIYDGYKFASFGEQRALLDNHRGIMRWHISFNMVVLRMVSFGLDFHWARLSRPSTIDWEEEASEEMTDSSVQFSVLCQMFHASYNAKKATGKRKHVRTFLDHHYTGPEYFSVMRLMLPSHDKVRGNYRLKETALGKCIAEALELDPTAPDAQRLSNWRKGGTRAGANAGNFAAIAGEILDKRQRVTSTGLTIKDVNDLLDRLAAAGEGKEKVAVLAEMINKTISREMQWIIKIILKDLKLGISEKSIFAEFHPDSEDVFSRNCNLKLTCEELSSRKERRAREDKRIEVGKAVKPQLASRAKDVESAWTVLKGKEVTVECKFDGERFQIHKDGTKIYYYSRSAIDHQVYNDAMADVLIQNVFPEKCILDGEMMTWDTSNNCFAPFGTNRGAAKAARDGLETCQQLCYIAFDILYLGNSSVIHLPLRERQELLYKSIRPVKGRLELLRRNSAANNQQGFGEPTRSFIAKSAQEVEHFFKQCVENREEGIVLKALDSKWEPDDRKGMWQKLKPDYVHATSDIDVLVIGGYFGSGRKGGMVAQFLLGIAEKPKSGEYPTKFRSFCRVGTGLTDEKADELVQKLNPYFRTYEKNGRPPSCYIVTNNSKERPDVWVDSPEKSVILEINSDIRTIDTEVFATPYGLRFPRIKRVRYEKPWYDCLDVQTLVEMVKAERRSTADPNAHDKPGQKEKRQRKPSSKFLPLVPSHMRNTDVSHVEHTTKIFDGLVLHIVSNPVEYSKDSLHKLVAENGGEFFMNINAAVTHVIASERKGIKFQAAAAHGDVIHYSWIRDCCNAKTLLPVSPKYYLHLSNQTKEKRKDEICPQGDHYFLDVDTTDLSQIFKNINMAEVAVDSGELARLKKKHCLSLTFCQFSDCHFYFHKPIHSSNPDSQLVAEIALRRQELEVAMHSGDVSEKLNSNVTHMIVYTSLDQKLPFRTVFKSVDSEHRKFLQSDKLKILSHQWLDDHKLGTCGHPEEANYDLRDPSFEFNEGSTNQGGSNEHGNVRKRPRLARNAEHTKHHLESSLE